jgi:hypothetical protein
VAPGVGPVGPGLAPQKLALAPWTRSSQRRAWQPHLSGRYQAFTRAGLLLTRRATRSKQQDAHQARTRSMETARQDLRHDDQKKESPGRCSEFASLSIYPQWRWHLRLAALSPDLPIDLQYASILMPRISHVRVPVPDWPSAARRLYTSLKKQNTPGFPSCSPRRLLPRALQLPQQIDCILR